MGCLNSEGQFSHWFGNIHLSGPCNRSCFFCIGQHMQSLETYDVLDNWPLDGLGDFIDACHARLVNEVNITGTNTDPLLYKRMPDLVERLHDEGFRVGVRTNGAANLHLVGLFDKGSISVHSLDPVIYRQIMGSGSPPDLAWFVRHLPDLKLNIVLCPQNVGGDLERTIVAAAAMGVERINVREPYGQPHIGDVLAGMFPRIGTRLGMPQYACGETIVTYWDVHYVEVESVNLYANGTVSETYPITKGYDAVEGRVLDQSHWAEAKRHLPQWPRRHA